MVPAGRLFRVVVDGTPAAYREAGQGHPLVLVHGAGARGSVFWPQLAGLASAVRVLAPDLPGHGASEGPGLTRIEAYADWLVRWLDALEITRVVVVGHSMGGAVAQTVALARPERLSALGLLDTGASLGVRRRILDLLSQHPQEGVGLIDGLSYAPDTPRERITEAERALRETAPLVTLGDFLACDRFDVTARVGLIRAPTLVMVGQHDRLTPPRQSEALAAAIAGSRLAVIPDAGHYAQLEQPDVVNATMAAWLAEVVPAGSRRAG